jgi:2-desacetyl-2-hydroxyethyl bacteriochlorophyllide A dehydrogenase
VEVREEPLPALGADDVLVESICSAISAGTEMLVYQGRFPKNLETDVVISSLRGGFKYPCVYGYACAGVVRDTGSQVDQSLRERLVFAFQPHASHFITHRDFLLQIPASLSPDSACFLPNMETAINLVQDGAPLFGEHVLVLGQGVIGLLTASLLRQFPLETLVTADSFELRREASLDLNVNDSLDPDPENFQRNASAYAARKFDLTFELSGNPSALNDALALTCFSGRIVVGSWYGEKRAEIDLGGAFHRSRIKLISSQVSTIAPELSGRWDKGRRFVAAWKALAQIRPEKWITHRFPIDQAEEAYRLLDENPAQTMQVLLTYS